MSALWEVGNENYGSWETDNHPGPHTPASYAQNAAPFFQAMHQADVIGETNISNAEISYNVQPVAALFAAGTALEWLSQGT